VITDRESGKSEIDLPIILPMPLLNKVRNSKIIDDFKPTFFFEFYSLPNVYPLRKLLSI